jgi:ferredoxin
VSAFDPILEKQTRLQDVRRGAPFLIEVDGQTVEAYPGETIATVLLASGKRVFNYAPDGSPRSYCCGIGRCFSCLVTVDNVANIRACKTAAQPGMRVQTGLIEARPE